MKEVILTDQEAEELASQIDKEAEGIEGHSCGSSCEYKVLTGQTCTRIAIDIREAAESVRSEKKLFKP